MLGRVIFASCGASLIDCVALFQNLPLILFSIDLHGMQILRVKTQ